jgi:hypothetical protein
MSTTEQPAPIPGAGNETDPDVQTRVIRLIEERRRHGIDTYGTALYPFNGRDSSRDAFEEALDLTLYLAQQKIERDVERAAIISLLWFARELQAGTHDRYTHAELGASIEHICRRAIHGDRPDVPLPADPRLEEARAALGILALYGQQMTKGLPFDRPAHERTEDTLARAGARVRQMAEEGLGRFVPEDVD